MTISQLTQDIVSELIKSPVQFPVDFDLAWKWLEISRKDNAKKSLTQSRFIEGIDFCVSLLKEGNAISETKTSIRGRKEGRKSEKIWLTTDCFKTWAMMVATIKGDEVRKYFLECERVAKSITVPKVYSVAQQKRIEEHQIILAKCEVIRLQNEELMLELRLSRANKSLKKDGKESENARLYKDLRSLNKLLARKNNLLEDSLTLLLECNIEQGSQFLQPVGQQQLLFNSN